MASAFNANSTIGALQVGVLASYVLFGITTMQIYVYYTRYPNDSPHLKLLVAFVWCCELAHAICFGHVLYSFTIIDYGHPELLFGKQLPTIGPAILVSGLIIASVQGFYTYRIYMLSKKRYLGAIFAVLCAASFTGSIVVFVGGELSATLAAYLVRWGDTAVVFLSVSAAADLAIAGVLVGLLRSSRVPRFEKTNILVQKLIKWTLETGVLTSLSGVITAVTFATMRHNLIWLGFYAVKSRLFANSLLASLNSRAALRAANSGVTTLPFPTPTTTVNIEMSKHTYTDPL